MRLLMLSWRGPNHPRAGGAEVYTQQVLSRMAARGHEVTWFTSRPELTVGEVDRIDGILMVRRGGSVDVYRQGRRFLRETEGNYDLVVDQVNTIPFKPRTAIPVVGLVHQLAREVWNAELPWPMALVGRYLAEPWWLWTTRRRPTITVSPSSLESLRRAGFDDLYDIGEGLELPGEAKPLPKEADPTLIYVGRLAANKRPLHAVETVVELARRGIGVTLWIVGDGPQRAEVEEAARAAERDGVHVEMWGRVSDAAKYQLLSRAWVLVVPSIREGWGLVVDEAAAVGTPAAGYPVPGLVDSIPAAGGKLAAANTPIALADSVELILEGDPNPGGERRGGWKGGAVGWGEVTDRFEAVLRRVVDVVRDGATGPA